MRTQAGAPPTDKLFTGQQRETAGGVYHYNARMYSADTGRFPQADTVVPDTTDPQALNRYAYVRNSPAMYTDPTGHFSDVGPLQIPVPKMVPTVVGWEGVQSWSYQRGAWIFNFASDEIQFFSYVAQGNGVGNPASTYYATIRATLRITNSYVALDVIVALKGDKADALGLRATINLLDGGRTGSFLQLGYCPGDIGSGCLVPVGQSNYGATIGLPLSAPTKVKIGIGTTLKSTESGLRFSSMELSLDLRTGRSGQNTCLPIVGCL